MTFPSQYNDTVNVRVHVSDERSEIRRMRLHVVLPNHGIAAPSNRYNEYSSDCGIMMNDGVGVTTVLPTTCFYRLFKL